MYSQAIIDRRQWQIERTYSVRLHRYDVDESIAINNALCLPESPDRAYDERGRQTRPLTQPERDFIWNEWNLAAIDFRYFAQRYATIVPDDALARRATIKFTPAQEIILSRMAATEERMWSELDRGHDRFNGQCYFIHKAGQMGISTHAELVGCHLVNFYPDTAGLVASTNDEKTQKVYTDYLLNTYNGLPPWMQSPLKSKTKDRGLDFVSGSQVVLQDASQKSGLGQGAKWHYVHVTELASWENQDIQFEKHLLPRISMSLRAVAFAESNSQGMHDWWHTHTELARKGEYNRWQSIFIGWWLVPQFRRMYPPDGWTPRKETLEEEQLIIQRSPDFTQNGTTFRPTPEMMYWWESTRNTYELSGSLNEFYKEHPSIPEQSFTHSGKSSFGVETLERLQRGTYPPTVYELASRDTPSELVITEPREVTIDGKRTIIPPPKIHTVGKFDVVPILINITQLREDPRGLILIWEDPSPRHDYFAGVDVCGGIANWSRWLKRSRSMLNDNGVVEIARRGFYGQPDVQVCEFAAPILPQDLAVYASVLGRLFTGREEDGCLMTVEVNLWGSNCQQEMIERYDYNNLYVRRTTDDGVNVKFAERYGFVSNHQTQRRLWANGKKHHAASKFIARSEFLVAEMRDCTDDSIHDHLSQGHVKPSKQEGSMRHDDRVYGHLFCLEGAHSFTEGLWAAPNPLEAKFIIEGSPRKNSFADRDYTHAEYQDMLADWEADLGEL